MTLALAIGANTAMFSVVNAVLLRPLPLPSPAQLAMAWIGSPEQNRQDRVAYGTFEEWRQRSRSFADLAAFDAAGVTLTGSDGADRIFSGRVSPSFFSVLGVDPARGRFFSAEDANERRRVVVISHRFWQSRLGGTPDALGASIVLDGAPSQIVGILPAGFDVPGFNTLVWEPLTVSADWENRRLARGAGPWFVIGRLRANVTLDQARAAMTVIARDLDRDLPPADRNRGVSVTRLDQFVVAARPRLALWMLAGAVLCVLLIAAANVASLSLARSVGRTREIAVRSTLGASPARIVRQLLAESVTLGAIAGVLGTLVAVAMIDAIRRFGPVELPRLDDASLDLPVLAWALVVSLSTGILVGMAPALTALRRSARSPREEDARGVAGSVAVRGVRRGLVVAEFALAIVLLSGAGLLVRSWLHLERVDPGFSPRQVLSVQLSATALQSPAQRAAFYLNVVEQVESLPGVESAGIVGDLFVSNDAEPILTTEGSTGVTTTRLRLRMDEASEQLFATLRTPLLRGRFFTADDRPDAPPVVIINEVMASRLWPGSDPIGRRFKFGPPDSDRPWFTVVGVVGDMRRQGLETEPIPQMFEPLTQNPGGLATLLVRTSAGDALQMAGAVRAAVGRVNRQMPLYGVTTLEARLADSLAERRLQTALLIGFSIVALLMAVVGIYGLIHYTVVARTHEIGIRMAVGARAGDVFRMIVREGLQLTVMGLLLGLVGAAWVGRAVSSLLFGVTAADPVTFMAVSAVLIVAALAACYFPARRAMTIEPVTALRQT
jgi:putative ABC transport system permease protein